MLQNVSEVSKFWNLRPENEAGQRTSGVGDEVFDEMDLFGAACWRHVRPENRRIDVVGYVVQDFSQFH